MAEAATFRLVTPGEPALLDALDLWQIGSHPEAAAGSSQPSCLVWRADLPQNPDEAQTALTNHARALTQTNRALAVADILLESDLITVQDVRGTPSHYSLGLSADEDRLAILAGGLAHQPEPVEFSTSRRDARSDEIETVNTIGRFTGLVQRLVGQINLVESVSAGRRTGLTRLEWPGGLQTWWAPGSPPASIPLHLQLLEQALATRQAWMRFWMLICSTTVKIGLAIASGPFLPVALFTAFKYLRKLVEQARMLRLPAPG